MHRRYIVLLQEDGWSVFDSSLNQPVTVDGQLLVDLPRARAEILATLLNSRIATDGSGATA